MIYLKVKEYIILKMEIDMKGILKMIKEKEKENIIIIKKALKVIFMKVILKMIKEKEKEYYIGIVVVEIKVILKMI